MRSHCPDPLQVLLAVFITLAAFLCVAHLLADVQPQNPQPAIVLPCEVLSIHDGDTLKVECRFVMDIRLLDCWSPEITGDEKPLGLKAKANLQRLAEGKEGVVTIPLTSDNIGKATTLGRILGRVSIDGKDLSEQQVKAKFATKEKVK